MPAFRESREQFRREMRNGEVVLLPDAGHSVFVGRTQDQVAAKTRAFYCGSEGPFIDPRGLRTTMTPVSDASAGAA